MASNRCACYPVALFGHRMKWNWPATAQCPSAESWWMEYAVTGSCYCLAARLCWRRTFSRSMRRLSWTCRRSGGYYCCSM